MTILQKIKTWGTAGLVSLAFVLVSGCSSEQWEAHKTRVRESNQRHYNKVLAKIIQNDNEKFGRTETINEYQEGNNFYFSKAGYPCRYMVKLDTMQGYRLCPGETEWAYNQTVTEQANKNPMFTIPSARQAQDTQTKDQTSTSAVDTAVGTFGGNAATMGLQRAIQKYGR